MTPPARGDVWLVDLEPVAGHEQGGTRPCVVVSDDVYNRLPIDMAIVVPLTARDRGLRHQPTIAPEPAGLKRPSHARPEDIRAVSRGRFGRRLGAVGQDELAAITACLTMFLRL